MFVTLLSLLFFFFVLCKRIFKYIPVLVLSLKTGGTSKIYDNEVPGYMIVFTDGISANIKPELDQDMDLSYLTGEVRLICLLFSNLKLNVNISSVNNLYQERPKQ